MMGLQDGWLEELEVFLFTTNGRKQEQTAVLTGVFQAEHQSPVEIWWSTEQGHTIVLQRG